MAIKIRRQRRESAVRAGTLNFLLGAVCGGALCLALTQLFPSFLFGEKEEPDVTHYREVRDFARTNFVREVDPDEMLDDALQGMLSSLDEYSRYYDEVDSKALNRETVGRYMGLGIVLKRPISEGRILFPLPDSPAEVAGVRVGDLIVAVDGKAILPSEFRTEHLRPNDSEDGLDLEVVGLDGTNRTLFVPRASLVDPTVRHARLLDPERGIGYLSIHSFSRTTTAEFEQTFNRLREDGMRSLVLDLRGNFGGVLSAAIDIAGRFIAEGTLVSTEGQGPPVVYVADPKIATLEGFPLVVLVDGNSASASEVLAAALQDHRAAVVVGAPTYGKGLVQQIRRFPNRQTIAKVTSSYYYTPSHQNLERTLDEGRDYGIRPDLEVALERSERNAIYGFLNGYSPPPQALPALHAWEDGSAEDVIPRAPSDAQLDAGVALLRGARPGPTKLSSELDPDRDA